MNKTKAQKPPWTQGEKFLLGAVLLAVALAVLGTVWWHRASDEPVVSIPTPAMPTQNAYTYFQSAAALKQDDSKVSWAIIPWNPHLADPPKHDPTYHYYSPADKAALVQENAAALKTLRQGFAYPCQSPPVRSYRSIGSGYSNLRQLARLLTLDGQVKQGRGDWDGAMGSQLDAIEMGQDSMHGGPLMAMLTGFSCESMGQSPLWKCLDHLNATQSRAAARRMEKIIALHVPFAQVIQEEEWSQEAELLELFRDPRWRGDWRALVYGGYLNYGWSRQQQVQMLLVSKKTVIQDYQTYMDQAIRDAHQPYAAHPKPPTMSLDPLTQMVVLGDLDSFRFHQTEPDTQNALLVVSFALRAYRLEHGAYPATLSALVPGYLSRVPDDPFALSGPLHYKHQGGKYVLYSVGPDGKDDGGKPVFDASKPPPPAGSERDYRNAVWNNSVGDVVAGVNGI